MKKPSCRKFFNLLKSVDIFGCKIELSLQKNKCVKSKFGATLTLIILLACIYSFSANILDWRNNTKLQTITSSRSSNVPEIISKNLSSFYDFDYLNYNIYFALISVYNDTVLSHEELNRYLTQEVIYKYNEMPKNIQLEPCNQAKQDAFLMDSESKINADSNISSIRSLCIKNSFRMGFYVFKNQAGVNTPNINYFVRKCKNSTENNFSCAAESEINEVIKSTYLQLSLPQNIYDFNDPTTPRKRTYDNQIYIFDNNLNKLYQGYLVPTIVKTDFGLISENYEVDSIDFNLDNMQYQSNFREKEDPLMQFGLQVGFQTKTYLRKNVKLIDILSSLGGTLNLLMVIGKFIGLSYNSVILQYKLINYSFENLDEKRKIR